MTTRHPISLSTFRTSLFSKAISFITLFFFVWSFCLFEPAYAAQQELTKQQRAEAAFDTAMETSPEAKLAWRLQKLKDKVSGDIAHNMQQRQAGSSLFSKAKKIIGLGDMPLADSEVTMLNDLQQSIDAAWKGSDDFAVTEQHIKDKKLPRELLQRVSQARQKVQGDYSKMQQLLNSVKTAKRAAAQQQAFDNLAAFLQTQQFQQGHTALNPNHLPFGTPKPTTRKPAENSIALYQLTHDNVQLAANSVTPGMLTGVYATPTPSPADLAESMDTVQTQAIKDLATTLHHSPVEIYSWVHDNIRFVPSYGSIQGADMTLQTKRGNAMDTASLLIALLRASNIPARYAYGTVDIPTAKVMNWVGNVQVPEAAMNLMGQGGIPNTGISINGVLGSIRMEHTWVEAFVDFEASRGVKNNKGDTWVPMDASYKQYDYAAGIDINTAAAIDQNAFLNQVQQGATIDSNAGYAQNINMEYLNSAYDSATSNINNYLAQQQHDPAATIVEKSDIHVLPASPLSAGLPYQLVAKQSHFSELADKLRYKIKIALVDTDATGNPTSEKFHYEIPLAGISGRRISLEYVPATDMDKAVIDQAFLNSTELRPYLINVVPKLMLEKNIVAQGAPLSLGLQQLLVVDIVSPSEIRSANYHLVSGNQAVLGINYSGAELGSWNTRIAQHDLQHSTDFDSLQEFYHQVMMGYWLGVDQLGNQLASSRQTVMYRMPSHGLAFSPLSVEYYFGVPVKGIYKSRILDVKENRILAVEKNNDQKKLATNVFLLGILSSTMESGIFELLEVIKTGYAMSAVSALRQAAIEGQRIYTLTSANINSAGSQLGISIGAMDDVTSAVAAGMRAIVHERPITNLQFHGEGYIVYDPITGSGAYRISGGRDGVDAPSAKTAIALPEGANTRMLGLMLGPMLAATGARVSAAGVFIPEIVLEGGGVIGAPELAALLILALLIAMLWDAIADITKSQQREFRILRHYTTLKNVPLIIASKFMIFSSQGTFGEGVYLANPEDAPNRGITCLPSLLDSTRIATAYQMYDEFGVLSVNRTAGWIDFEFSIPGVYVIEPIPNSNAVTEWVVTAPVVWVNVNGGVVKAVPFGPVNPHIKFESSCPYSVYIP